MTSPMAEVIEAYAETGKLLVQKWRDLGSDLATNLESGYDAEWASAYLGNATALTMETWTRLVLQGMAAIETLNMKRPMAWSKELKTKYKGAKLELTGDFQGAFKRTLPAEEAIFDPPKLGSEDTTFKVGIDMSGRQFAVYAATVRATASSGESEEIHFRIEYP